MKGVKGFSSAEVSEWNKKRASSRKGVPCEQKHKLKTQKKLPKGVTESELLAMADAVRENPEVIQSGYRRKHELKLEPGTCSKYILHSMRFFGLTQVNLSDPDDVRNRTIDYLQACADDDVKPTIEGYAFALGIDRSYLLAICYNNNTGIGRCSQETIIKNNIYNAECDNDNNANDNINNNDNDYISYSVNQSYIKGKNVKSKNLEVVQILKNTVGMLGSVLTGEMQDGKVNPLVGMFFLKNNHCYSDKTEIQVKTDNYGLNAGSSDEIAERYVDSVVVDAD